jgi:hypothetical protein
LKNFDFISAQKKMLFFLWLIPMAVNLAVFFCLVTIVHGFAALPSDGIGSHMDMLRRITFGYLPYIISVFSALLVLRPGDNNKAYRIPGIFYIVFICIITLYNLSVMGAAFLFVFVNEDAGIYVSQLESIKEYGRLVITPVFTLFYLKPAIEKLRGKKEK